MLFVIGFLLGGIITFCVMVFRMEKMRLAARADGAFAAVNWMRETEDRRS